MDIIDIYRVFHPTITQYAFFSAAHGTFSKTDHILGHKASLNKVKKIEMIPPTIISDHNEIEIVLNNTWKLNNT
jgi:exonuclease III